MKNNSWFSWLSSLLILAFVLPAAASTQPTETETSDFEELERLWNEAHVSGDAETLDRLWADDLIVTVPSMAPMHKESVLGFAKSGRMQFSRYETSDLQVRQYGDAAVVTGRMLRSRSLAGQQVDDDWRFTKVYIRRDGRWRVVAFQASPSP